MMAQFKHPCAYCGTTDRKLTDDHVPPTAVLVKPYPKRLKVRACEECNSQYAQHLDEDFRTAIAIWLANKTEDADRLWSAARASLRYQRPKLIDLISKIQPIFQPGAGGFPVYIGHGVPFRADVIEGAIERMTRGLYYRQYRNVLGLNIPVEVNVLSSTEAHLNVLGVHKRTIKVGDQFTCWYARAVDDPKTSVWVYTLHGGFHACAYTGKGATEKPAAPMARPHSGGILLP